MGNQIDPDLVVDGADNMIVSAFIGLARESVWEAGQAIDAGDVKKAREILNVTESQLDEVWAAHQAAAMARFQQRHGSVTTPKPVGGGGSPPKAG